MSLSPEVSNLDARSDLTKIWFGGRNRQCPDDDRWFGITYALPADTWTIIVKTFGSGCALSLRRVWDKEVGLRDLGLGEMARNRVVEIDLPRQVIGVGEQFEARVAVTPSDLYVYFDPDPTNITEEILEDFYQRFEFGNPVGVEGLEDRITNKAKTLADLGINL